MNLAACFSLTIDKANLLLIRTVLSFKKVKGRGNAIFSAVQQGGEFIMKFM